MSEQERAEQAYHKARPNSDEYESEIISMERVNWVELEHPGERTSRHWMTETVEWQEACWQIGFQYRWKRNGEWDQWYPGSCYVVSPKPGPYVVK